MDAAERIEEMERRLREGEAALSALETALEAYAALRPRLRELERYYESPDWLSDLDRDRAGELPPTLRRGVLSEDAVYDLLCREGELRERMRELCQNKKPSPSLLVRTFYIWRRRLTP